MNKDILKITTILSTLIMLPAVSSAKKITSSTSDGETTYKINGKTLGTSEQGDNQWGEADTVYYNKYGSEVGTSTSNGESKEFMSNSVSASGPKVQMYAGKDEDEENAGISVKTVHGFDDVEVYQPTNSSEASEEGTTVSKQTVLGGQTNKNIKKEGDLIESSKTRGVYNGGKEVRTSTISKKSGGGVEVSTQSNETGISRNIELSKATGGVNVETEKTTSDGTVKKQYAVAKVKPGEHDGVDITTSKGKKITATKNKGKGKGVVVVESNGNGTSTSTNYKAKKLLGGGVEIKSSQGGTKIIAADKSSKGTIDEVAVQTTKANGNSETTYYTESNGKIVETKD